VILSIIQARVSSSRLPGKVLEPILGVPLLARLLERVALCARIDKFIVATSTRADDDAIERLCAARGIECFRGSLDDVLDRYHQAAAPHGADHVVRLTGDCPLADADVIDQIVAFHLDGSFDYTSNTIRPTYPDGLDTEVFRLTSLTQAWREARLPSEREHVTPYIKNSGKFRTANFTAPVDLSHLRWTVDEAEDLVLVREIYKELYPRDPRFKMADICALLRRRPELEAVNQVHLRDSGYEMSLARDRLSTRRTP
jgi:spore coat polysaccharide biosynthesis protein SpsF